jgi:hypothetical protein
VVVGLTAGADERAFLFEGIVVTEGVCEEEDLFTSGRVSSWTWHVSKPQLAGTFNKWPGAL